jgi:hypothetical protein
MEAPLFEAARGAQDIWTIFADAGGGGQLLTLQTAGAPANDNANFNMLDVRPRPIDPPREHAML